MTTLTTKKIKKIMADALPVMVTEEPIGRVPMHSKPIEATAALFWVNNQFLFKWQEDNLEKSKFLSPSTVRAAFNNEPVDSGWLSPCMVRCGAAVRGTFEMLYIPPGRHQFTFTRNEIMPETTYTLPMPGFFITGIGAEYFVFVAKESEFHSDMPLYNVPLPNVYTNGRVCWGAKQPDSAGNGAAYRAWQIFLETPFSNHNVTDKSKSYKSDIRLALMAYKDMEVYPYDDLITNQLTPLNVFQQAALHGV